MNRLEEVPLCLVCRFDEGRYRCPTCKVTYCSLPCYKKHSKECTEDFYERCVIAEMKATKATPEQKKEMNKLLHETALLDTSGTLIITPIDQEYVIPKNLKKRLKKLNEMIDSGKGSINLLTPLEQNSLLQYIQGITKFSNELPQWIPWWEHPVSHEGIEEITKDCNQDKLKSIDLNEINNFDEYKNEGSSDEEEECKEDINVKVVKARIKAIPAFITLWKREVSPILKYHIISTLYPLVFYYRLYNGSVVDDYEYIIDCCLKSSEALSNSPRLQQIATVELACSFALEKLIFIEQRTAIAYKNMILNDLRCIFTAKEYVLEGLLRYYDLLHRYEMNKGVDSKSKIKQKLIFYMAYIKDNFETIKEAIMKDMNAFIQREGKELEDKKVLRQVKRVQKEGIIIKDE